MNENVYKHYIVGVSIGNMSQPTAIAIIEQETRARGNWEIEATGLRLRHLERISLDMRYPAMVDHIDGLINKLKEHEQSDETDLIIDTTGTGSSVGNLIKESGLKPISVIITAGSGESETEHQNWRVSKAELVGGLQVALQSDRIDMAAELDLVPVLVKELQSFKMRTPTINDNDPESWREGQFDDLVFAVGLALWRTSKHTPYPPSEEEPMPPTNTSTDGWMA